MKNKPNKKKHSLSVRLKTSFAIQSHLEEFSYLMKMIDQFGDGFEEKEQVVQILSEALSESLSVVFPEPFEA
mgnify:CR=1 FL=1|tara:strand:- start:26 stop:241 length:216 start_codon:yes stop_codon:yes gene_type:complete